MPLTHVAFAVANLNNIATSGPWPIAASVLSEDIEPGAEAVETNIEAAGSLSNKPIARIWTDTDVYVSFGPEPDAETDAGRLLIPAGGPIETFYVEPGDKASVVAVAVE